VADWVPTVDISKTEAEYAIQAELPRVKKDAVKVTVENGILTNQGERRQVQVERGRRHHRRSRRNMQTGCYTSISRNQRKPSRSRSK
jgi:HSP20 family protein